MFRKLIRMMFLERIERLKRIDSFIRREATGSPKDFADRLCISQSKLYDELNILKELGAKIQFNKYIQSYKYLKPVKLVFELQDL